MAAGLRWTWTLPGYFFQQSAPQFCLAFAGNKDDRDIGIIGNVQQKRLHVGYDVARGKVGFAPLLDAPDRFNEQL